MSIARIALRIAAVEAIKGQTLVGGNVLDSEISAFDVNADGTIRTDREKPFVAVYTDASEIDLSGNDLRGLFGNGDCDLIFEAGIATPMVETDPDSGESVVAAGLPATDKNFEYFLDMTMRQISATLNAPSNSWAEIFRGLIFSISKIKVERAGNTDDGVKLAGHKLSITCQLIDDPVRGEAIDPDSPLGEFLAKLEGSGDAEYQKYAADIRAEVAAADEPWENVQRRLGVTADELLALGRGPIPQDANSDTPIMTAGTTEIEGHSPPVETSE